MARILLLAFATSTVLHGIAYASLELAPATKGRAPLSSVLLEAVETPPVAAETKPSKPLEPEQVLAPRPVSEREPAPPPEPAVATRRAPVDLSGVTLTNEDGAASFTLPGGDGSPRAGPLGPLRAAASVAPPPLPTPAVSAAAPAAPDVVPSGDLSERPRPPVLDSVLRSLYPDEARRRGISGSASLRVRIDPDGRVRAASTMVESFPGFGEACRKAVLGSRWSPPRDRDGHEVRTEVRYTCRFVVD